MPTQADEKAQLALQVDCVTLALTHDLVEEAEAAIAGLHALRPRVAEYDIFDAWLLMKRGAFEDAIRQLRGLLGSKVAGNQAKALLAYCQFASGDPRWSEAATQVIEADADEDSCRLMRVLLNPGAASREPSEAEATPAASAAALAPSAMDAVFLRA